MHLLGVNVCYTTATGSGISTLERGACDRVKFSHSRSSRGRGGSPRWIAATTSWETGRWQRFVRGENGHRMP